MAHSPATGVHFLGEDSSDLSSVPDHISNEPLAPKRVRLPLGKRQRKTADEGQNPTSVQKADHSGTEPKTTSNRDASDKQKSVPSSKKRTTEAEVELQIIDDHTNAKLKSVTKKSKRGAEENNSAETDEPVKLDVVISTATGTGTKAVKSRKRRGNRKEGEGEPEKEPDEEDTKGAAKPKRTRKTKEEKEAALAPMAARTIGSKMLVGAHVSSGGGTARLNMIGLSTNTTDTPSACRCPQRHHQRQPHRRQRLRPLPQVPAQVGQPPTQARACHRLRRP